MMRLKHDSRGISNVIVVMLSLVLIVVIAANVVLWSYQMNQFDWERTQEKIEIINSDHIYAEQIREFKANRTFGGTLKLGSSAVHNSLISSAQSTNLLSNIEKTRVKMELAELKKMQSHIKYTFTQIERKIAEIERKLGL